MNDIINDIIYTCGMMTIFFIVFFIILGIILKIKEITYDAHQNSIELSNLNRKHKKARDDIREKVKEYSGSGNEVTQAYCDGFKDSLAILDALIESED